MPITENLIHEEWREYIDDGCTLGTSARADTKPSNSIHFS
jgi:hypothetical protein